ncbi:putative protein kinase RLK-Pelle-RLCK-XI family [Helianthus annuus]|nr:putative protein kinase RLK-Pelle-RLCK-XI family [Helianthus annuus]
MSTLPPTLPEFPSDLPPPAPPYNHRHHHGSTVLHSVLAGVLVFILFVVLAIAYRKISRKRTVPADLKSPSPQPKKQLQQFSYKVLRRATSAFAASNRLGQGGFGSVYKGVLPSGKEIAVKLMNGAGSLQGEREFHNELSLSTRINGACGAHSRHVVSVIGFASDQNRRRRKKMLIVYEYMQNGSLQDALLYLAEETESVVTGDVVVNVDLVSPESCRVTVVDMEASPSEYLERTSVSDQISVDSSNRRFLGKKKSGVGGGGGSGRDWWWKQESWGGDSGRVKDYVMEWIGSEIKKERPKKDWLTTTDQFSSELESSSANGPQKKQKKKAETDKKNRKPREWWKEEFCDELAKKKKKKRRGSNTGEMWWQRDEEFVPQKKKSKSSSKSSIDWWLDGLSGEFRHRRRNSQECPSGEIPKSGGISSTPSMRGTVCYIAPEKCDGGQLSEKSDVYSYGVLLLVLVSGRRPLQVTASPMSEFERANLISWARQLARNGKLLDLVDPNIHSLDQEQAMLCITTALLCLQRSPVKRPTMREVVGMLSGEADPPHLPFEFSPSPPTNIPFKSRRKPR